MPGSEQKEKTTRKKEVELDELSERDRRLDIRRGMDQLGRQPTLRSVIRMSAASRGGRQ